VVSSAVHPEGVLPGSSVAPVKSIVREALRGVTAPHWYCASGSGLELFCPGWTNGLGEGEWAGSYGFDQQIHNSATDACVEEPEEPLSELAFGIMKGICCAHEGLLIGFTGPDTGGGFYEACGGGQGLGGPPWSEDPE
jgi:hypothetical protein